MADLSGRLRFRMTALAASAIFVVAACTGSSSPPPGGTPAGGTQGPSGTGPTETGAASIGGQVNVWTAWGGDELKAYQEVLAPFIAESGIQVNLLTIRDQDLQLSNNVEAGTSLPDIANPPNPQRYEDWATRGIMKPLEDFIDMEAYLADTAPGLLFEDPNYGFIGGKHYLMMVKSQVKGLIWYNPKVYTGAAPATWDELNAIQPPEGTSLWCAAFESGGLAGIRRPGQHRHAPVRCPGLRRLV
jgi:maltose-binding protein MalE